MLKPAAQNLGTLPLGGAYQPATVVTNAMGSVQETKTSRDDVALRALDTVNSLWASCTYNGSPAQRLQATALRVYSGREGVNAPVREDRMQNHTIVYTLSKQLIGACVLQDRRTLQVSDTMSGGQFFGGVSHAYGVALSEGSDITLDAVGRELTKAGVGTDRNTAAVFKIYGENGRDTEQRVAILTGKDGAFVPGGYEVWVIDSRNQTAKIAESTNNESMFIGSNEYPIGDLGTLTIKGTGEIVFAMKENLAPIEPLLLFVPVTAE